LDFAPGRFRFNCWPTNNHSFPPVAAPRKVTEFLHSDQNVQGAVPNGDLRQKSVLPEMNKETKGQVLARLRGVGPPSRITGEVTRPPGQSLDRSCAAFWIPRWGCAVETSEALFWQMLEHLQTSAPRFGRRSASPHVHETLR
jgi:hypothetical protein